MTDIVELLNLGNSACARYEEDGRPEDFEGAVARLEAAINASRESSDHERLSYALAVMARAHRARFRWSSDREGLGTAYVLAFEAIHRASEGDCFQYALQTGAVVLGALESALDRERLADIDWELSLARGLAEQLDGEQYFLLARIATVLNRRAAITQSEDDILAMAEVGTRAAELCPSGFEPIRELRAAAQGWSFMGRSEDAVHLLHKGVDMWRRAVSSVHHDDSDVTELVHALLCMDALEADDSSFEEALRHMQALSDRPDDIQWSGEIHGMHAASTVSAVARKYLDGGIDAHLDAAIAFGTRCLKSLQEDPAEALETMARLWNLHDLRFEKKRLSEDFDRRESYADQVRRLAPAGSKLRQLVGDVRAHEATARYLWRKFGTVTWAIAEGRVYPHVGPISMPVGKWDASEANPIGCHMTSWCTRALHYPAGTDVGPVPLLVPSWLLNVEITVTAPPTEGAVINAIRIMIEARYPLTIADVFLTNQDDVGGFDYYVDLDAQDPEVATPTGPPESPLLTIRRGGTETIFVAASARKWDIRWRLEFDWTCGIRSGTFTAPLRTTGESGFRKYGPHE